MLIPWRVSFTGLFFSQMNMFFFRWVGSTLWTSGPWNLPSWELTCLLQFGTFEDDLDTLLPSSVEFHPFPEKTFKSFFSCVAGSSRRIAVGAGGWCCLFPLY